MTTSEGGSLPLCWGTAQYTWPTHEKRTPPLPEEERYGSEHPLTLQRQLEGAAGVWKSWQSDNQAGLGAEAANSEEDQVGEVKLSTQILLLMKKFPACPTTGLPVEEMGHPHPTSPSQSPGACSCG